MVVHYVGLYILAGLGWLARNVRSPAVYCFTVAVVVSVFG